MIKTTVLKTRVKMIATGRSFHTGDSRATGTCTESTVDQRHRPVRMPSGAAHAPVGWARPGFGLVDLLVGRRPVGPAVGAHNPGCAVRLLDHNQGSLGRAVRRRRARSGHRRPLGRHLESPVCSTTDLAGQRLPEPREESQELTTIASRMVPLAVQRRDADMLPSR